MKKVLITTITMLTSLASFAASTNYSNAMINDDGTTTIVLPKFKVATGSNSKLSSRSEVNGVCKLYGYDFSVGSSAVIVGDERAKTTIIGRNGRFSATYSYNNRTSNSYIKSIVCAKNHQVLTTSVRNKPVLNDDGSYTILNPIVGYYNVGKTSRVSSRSNPAGVCKYYGLESAVANGVQVTGDTRERTVILDSNGSFSNFYKYNNNSNNSYITAIVCEGATGAGDDIGRDDLDLTVEITKRELLRMQNKIRKLSQNNSKLIDDLNSALSSNAQLKQALDAKILELEQEIELNGAAKKQLKKLKKDLERIAGDL